VFIGRRGGANLKGDEGKGDSKGEDFGCRFCVDLEVLLLRVR
jgi:hypothetical protein